MVEQVIRKLKNGLWVKTTKLQPKERSPLIDFLEYNMIPSRISISTISEFADLRVEVSNDGAKFYEIIQTNPDKSELYWDNNIPPARIFRLFNASKKSKIEKISWLLLE